GGRLAGGGCWLLAVGCRVLRLGDAASAASLGGAGEGLGEFADPMVLEAVDEFGDLIAQLRLGEGGGQRVELPPGTGPIEGIGHEALVVVGARVEPCAVVEGEEEI